MRIHLRLDQFLKLDPNDAGELTKLAAKIGISKYQLKHLLDNGSREIKREVLSKVCDYLVEAGLADEADLPAALFARDPTRFWHLLCERERVSLCMGWRPDEFRDQVVIAADSQLQANLLYCMTQVAARDEEEPGRRRRKGPRIERMPPIIDPSLVRTWDRKRGPEDLHVLKMADDFYDRFTAKDGDKALVCFGSVKSNPVIERVLASTFCGAKAFTSQDDVARPQDRACPFVMVYRDTDPKPPSICGGQRLSQTELGSGPGIYYEGPDQAWRRVAWDQDEYDAALVFYRLQRSLGRLELVLGGFSGRGTKCLAKYIRDTNKDMTEFWPATISTDDVDVAAFVVKFRVKKAPKKGPPPTMPEFNGAPQVFRLDKSVLERRLAA